MESQGTLGRPRPMHRPRLWSAVSGAAQGSRAATWAAIAWVIVLGTLLHFVFDWAGRLRAVGVVAPVNESVWEHAKLLFWPTLSFVLLDRRRLAASWATAWVATGVAALLGPALMIAGFYAYVLVIPHNLAADLLLFAVAAGLAQFVAAAIYARHPFRKGAALALAGLIAGYLALQTAWTFAPPQWPPFRDGPTGTYGLIDAP